MGRQYDRDTKIAYVEQIESGKLTVTEAVRELGCSRSTIYSWMKKLSEDGEHALPGNGHMKLPSPISPLGWNRIIVRSPLSEQAVGPEQEGRECNFKN